MKKIDTTNWREFQIKELFYKLDLKCRKKTFHKATDVSLTKSDEFNLPLVNAKHSNNGIMYYGRSEDFEAEDMTIDIVEDGAASTGDVYPQPQSTGVLYNAYLIKLIEPVSSKYVLFFLSAIIERSVKQKFGYENKCTWDKVKEVNVLLPVTTDRKPNWAYMEQYMQNIEGKVNSDILSITSALDGSKSQIKVDTTNWRRFHLYDDELFTIDNGTKLDRVKMSENNPSINFVGRANANNGVTACVDKIEGIMPYDAGCLTISLGGEYLGSCFVQEKPFYTSQNVNVLIPKHPMSDYCKRFISTMIFREGRIHYKAFVDELNRHMRRDFSILLPVTSSNTPDWEYMEKYMQMIEQKTKNALYYLAS